MPTGDLETSRMKEGIELNAASRIEHILSAVARDIRHIFESKLRRIILFGSFARGDNNSESDIDIMVLADIADDETPLYQKKINQIASAVSLENDITVSISLRDASLFVFRAEFHPFYRNVLTEGVEVYAAK